MPGSQPGGGECLRERAACAGVGRWSPPCLQPAGNCPVCGSSAEVPRVTRVGRESVPAKEEQRGVSAQAGMGRGSLVTRARPFGVGTSAGGQTGEPGEWVSTDEQMQGEGCLQGRLAVLLEEAAMDMVTLCSDPQRHRAGWLPEGSRPTNVLCLGASGGSSGRHVLCVSEALHRSLCCQGFRPSMLEV